MKRQRENGGTESSDVADCFVMFSQERGVNRRRSLSPQVFECKTCSAGSRRFNSWVATASHKRPKPDGEEELKAQGKSMNLGMGDKPKMHECSICGQGFSLGQALGGHMRKHREAIDEGLPPIDQQDIVAEVPVLKRSGSTRIFCLDLNLTPPENDLKAIVRENDT